jgi:SAM-dependent methyltransferase
MRPEEYEAWYGSPRGRWTSDREYALLRRLLRAEREGSLLDIGCGTGHFTRLFAQDVQGAVVGMDPNGEWLRYARAQARKGEAYVAARAERLPFPDRSFDYTVSVTALCFVGDQQRALCELQRVTRKRFVLGLLNRHSLLYLQKGRGGGKGAYAGAHWHSAAEVRNLLASLPAENVVLRTAIVLPQATFLARTLESRWPAWAPLGGFLAVAGEIVDRKLKAQALS